MSQSAQDVATFGQYGRGFQERILQAALVDHKWAEQITEVIDVGYFDLKYWQFLAVRYFAYAKKYHAFPSLQLLVTIIRDELKSGTDATMRDQIIDYLQRMRTNPDPGDLQYCKEKSLEFCRKQALKKALEEAVDQIRDEKYEMIVENIKKATMVGTAPAVGHDFFNDFEARFTRLKRCTVPTGLDEIDKNDVLNGGLGNGELGCVIGSTGAGKCTNRKSQILIRYVGVKIDGRSYKPWERVRTKRGEIFAKDVVVTDENISSIEYYDVNESIEAGDLFTQIEFSDNVEATDDSGDSYVANQFAVEVRSLDAYYPIEGFRWTKPERQVTLTHKSANPTILEDCLPALICSPEHIVLRLKSGTSDWCKVGDLSKDDIIVGYGGDLQLISPRKVVAVTADHDIERLCDMQVSIAHSYFADGILSHNSHFLVMLGAYALRTGVDVLHYTFELSETAVGVRYDSNLCDIPSNAVIDSKDLVLDHYKGKKYGRLLIKEFPTNSCSIHTIRAHIERLNVRGFNPGLIIIDYADIMRSTRQYDSLRHELKLIYEELRGFAMEKGVPIWTASQSNKDGATSDVIDLGNMSEAYGKAMVCDVVLSISRKAMEKASGSGRLYVAKNRAGRDGIIHNIQIDTARSKFKIIGEAGSFEEVHQENEDSIKQALRKKWNELKKDPLLTSSTEQVVKP